MTKNIQVCNFVKLCQEFFDFGSLENQKLLLSIFAFVLDLVQVPLCKALQLRRARENIFDPDAEVLKSGELLIVFLSLEVIHKRPVHVQDNHQSLGVLETR